MSVVTEISTRATQKVNHSRSVESNNKRATKSKKGGGSAAKKAISLTRVQIIKQK